MSRGFVKESDQEELPFIAPRAALPAGMVNYVTPAGLEALEKERADLEAEKAALPSDHEEEHRRAATVLDGKLALLQERIHTARVLDPRDQPKEEVRFGAKVSLQFLATGKKQTFQLVGVDEANIKAGKIAFTAPIAQAITGLWEGEVADLHMGGEVRKIRVLGITY